MGVIISRDNNKVSYKNGNSVVTIDISNGTKERFTFDDDFNLDFPESLDICCTTYCDGGCRYCYADCTTNGIHADLLNVDFINTLHPYTEVALQLNDLSHPQMYEFLELLKAKQVIANITVNQIHFEKKEDIIADLVNRDLIKGIGISLQNPTPEFVSRVKKYPNAVIHVIAGVVTADQLEALRDNNLKLLILGYKTLGRGIDYGNYNKIVIKLRQRYLEAILETLPAHFDATSFDNLAIAQLNVRRIFSDEDWDMFYLGDEGTSSMFIDLVSGKFGVSSLCEKSEMMPLMDNINDMFDIVKRKAKIG